MLISYPEKPDKLGFFSAKIKVIGANNKMFEENDGVRLKRDLPERNLKPGIIGTVVMVYNYTPVWGFDLLQKQDFGN